MTNGMTPVARMPMRDRLGASYPIGMPATELSGILAFNSSFPRRRESMAIPPSFSAAMDPRVREGDD
jgi:hypothetical protein